MANISQNKVSVYMTDELKQSVAAAANKKSMSTSAFLVSLINADNQQGQKLIFKELDKVITKPTKENYNRFIDILQDAFVTRQILETEYDLLYSMVKIIPIK